MNSEKILLVGLACMFLGACQSPAKLPDPTISPPPQPPAELSEPLPELQKIVS